MKFIRKINGLSLEFEDSDSPELRRYAEHQMENSWEFIKMKSLNDKLAKTKESEEWKKEV